MEKDKKRLLFRRKRLKSEYGLGRLRRHCAICLEQDGRRAQLSPCQHDQFDYECIRQWLEKSLTCPICKQSVDCVYYDFTGPGRSKKWYPHSFLSQSKKEGSRASSSAGDSVYGGFSENTINIVGIRRRIYEKEWLSLSMASRPENIKYYRGFTPSQFCSDPSLQQRAVDFLATELMVFDYLGEEQTTFLREYILGLLKRQSILEEQTFHEISEFFGERDGSLFVHEMNRYLCSSISSLSTFMHSRSFVYGPEKLTMAELNERFFRRSEDCF
ncbi:ubiquitin-protein ligase E3 [Schizosaccharomyces cryophilus OY26]|uniref:RING-type E3 ubiquitin transferase n=1 Tax=Schizosaccharomyces cryophilus (strain OY26 / ATCC MYA-4695 / CBS 11777 / NBRC 106824 / NRRL Y48691) TaxID=653667 RepID=S9WZZ9_SCHCR|nr:ubiquitin-protein ligase E3 [Schizosaccharomyces cryophilus OY26]EPY50282.1 ubiquitin-protein ligase E3 [Schizosaccharomyces cryophilus OY26]